jgi:hypothetical protein
VKSLLNKNISSTKIYCLTLAFKAVFSSIVVESIHLTEQILAKHYTTTRVGIWVLLWQMKYKYQELHTACHHSSMHVAFKLSRDFFRDG